MSSRAAHPSVVAIHRPVAATHCRHLADAALVDRRLQRRNEPGRRRHRRVAPVGDGVDAHACKRTRRRPAWSV
jgi:hypothetical protein